MRTTIKTLVVILAAFVLSVMEASAQKISAAAIVDQHYAAQTSNYKMMMVALAAAYAVYLLLNMKRKREVNRFMGRI